MTAAAIKLRRDFAGSHLDLAGLVPGADLSKLRVKVDGRPRRLTDAFDIVGDDYSEVRINAAAAARLDHVGAGMDGGRLILQGPAGDYAGAGMLGGELHVKGSAGNLLGCGMRGGVISVNGAAGDSVGGADIGQMEGMNGGTILVAGDAGKRCGDRMRRGAIVVRGDCGAFAASRMRAGTLIIEGSTGPGLATGLRRGTVILLQGAEDIGSHFRSCGKMDFVALGLLYRELAKSTRGLKFLLEVPTTAERFAGDLAETGKGEIFAYN